MADAPTTYTAVSDDSYPVYLERRLLRLSELQMLLQGQQMENFTLPEKMGKTIRLNKYGRLNNPTAQLSEGVPPDAVALSVTKTEATVEQWGIVGLVTDVANATIFHDLMDVMNDRLSRAINETKEREIAMVLMGGTNVFYATGATARTDISASTKITTAKVIEITSSLRDNGAPDFGNNLYIGIVPPQLEADMLADATFVLAAQYSQVERLNNGEFGRWGGVRWSRMNFLPKYLGVGAPGTQSASVAGYSNETGAGAGIGGAGVVVVSRDAQSGYERKISQTKSVTAGKDTADVATPTSTNYVYDIYQSNTSGTSFKRVFTGVAANTTKTLTATTYTNGVSATPPTAPASGVAVFTAFIFGKEAYGDVKLSGMSLQMYVTPGGASFSDPLAQARKQGGKYMAKPKILNDAFMARLEAGSSISGNFPA
jgi:N4-gp56 family major capsid protein